MSSASDRSAAGRAAHRPSRRQEILISAIPVFSEFGPRATTSAIGQRSGVHSSAIYYHFGSKDQLFSEVVELIAARVEAATTAVEGDTGSVLSMATAVEAVWHWSEQHHDEARVLYVWAASGPAAARATRQRFVERYRARVVDRMSNRPRRDPQDEVVDSLAARAYMNMAMSLSQAWVVGESIGGTTDRSRIVAALVEVSRKLTGAE